MIFDWDDWEDTNTRLDLLWKLKALNPNFKCTVFAIPARTTLTPPDWIELAVHGWEHPTPRECENWTYEQCIELLDKIPSHWAKVFKAPGWQISDGCYKALLERGYIVADQPYNRDRRPVGLKVYELGSESWHGHIQSPCCNNGLEETFDKVADLVKNTEEFKWISQL